MSRAATASIGERLLSAARERLVGRDRELATLHAALAEAATRPRVVHIHGPAGVGKTALAEVFRLQARAAGHRLVWMSADGVAPPPAAFLERLSSTGLDAPARLGHGEQPDVLVVEAFSAALAAWFFAEVVSRAGSRLLVVLVGRERFDPSVRCALTVQPLLEELELTVLCERDVRELLWRAELPPRQHDRVLRVTGGLPLAVSLVLERHRCGEAPELEARELALVEEPPRDGAHRRTDPRRRRTESAVRLRSEGQRGSSAERREGAASSTPWSDPTRAEASDMRREVFDDHVKAALVALHRPHELNASPLIRTSLVALPGGGAAALADAIREAVDALGQSPAYRDLAEVLRVTYLDAAVKQRAAAYDLGLPYGTYRHRLRRAIALLAQELWERLARRGHARPATRPPGRTP